MPFVNIKTFSISILVISFLWCVLATGSVDLLDGLVDESLVDESSFPINFSVNPSDPVYVGYCVSNRWYDCDASDISSWTLFHPNMPSMNLHNSSHTSPIPDYSIDLSTFLEQNAQFTVDFYASDVICGECDKTNTDWCAHNAILFDSFSFSYEPRAPMIASGSLSLNDSCEDLSFACDFMSSVADIYVTVLDTSLSPVGVEGSIMNLLIRSSPSIASEETLEGTSEETLEGHICYAELCNELEGFSELDPHEAYLFSIIITDDTGLNFNPVISKFTPPPPKWFEVEIKLDYDVGFDILELFCAAIAFISIIVFSISQVQYTQNSTDEEYYNNSSSLLEIIGVVGIFLFSVLYLVFHCLSDKCVGCGRKDIPHDKNHLVIAQALVILLPNIEQRAEHNYYPSWDSAYFAVEHGLGQNWITRTIFGPALCIWSIFWALFSLIIGSLCKCFHQPINNIYVMMLWFFSAGTIFVLLGLAVNRCEYRDDNDNPNPVTFYYFALAFAGIILFMLLIGACASTSYSPSTSTTPNKTTAMTPTRINGSKPKLSENLKTIGFMANLAGNVLGIDGLGEAQTAGKIFEKGAEICDTAADIAEAFEK
ncbi:hypothetical protein ADUPG1_011435 [Aduncisulcus paluster]|uniref:Uncharacterized protein n=1 Tax=Aduncisulcus paluster TaxID=2918883 RepID=A0ABQ5K0K7_9EUKA|nr:hypothetical protein ADUPG1_011435 [Aduncisulcus paluster]